MDSKRGVLVWVSALLRTCGVLLILASDGALTATSTSQPTLSPVTHAPTSNAIAPEGYCEVPFDWNDSFSTPCNFGTDPAGWSYVNEGTGQVVRNIKGCARIGDVEPFQGSATLGPDDRWCPVELTATNEYQTPSDAWGMCECKPCRIIPNANPSGMLSQGLCDFGENNNWTYVGADGSATTGLSGCVTVRDFPPLGSTDLQVPLDAKWCSVNLDEGDVYNKTIPEVGLLWGLCECFNTSAPTASPTPFSGESQAPTSSPYASTSITNRECRIQFDDYAPVEEDFACNFGETGTWMYRGVTGKTIAVERECLSVSLYPPAEDAPPGLANARWCPGPSSLVNGVFDVNNSISSTTWGVCRCASCSLYDPDPELELPLVTEGLCGFFNDTDQWTYRFPNGTESVITQCASIYEYPPFGVEVLDLGDLPEEKKMWCPDALALTDGVYDTSSDILRELWGFCRCRGNEASVTMVPSRAPTSFIIPGDDDQVICIITSVPAGNTATAGVPCGFTSSLGWYYVSNTQNSGPGAMFGGVTIGQYPPFYPTPFQLNPNALWCPASASLIEGTVYSPEVLGPTDRRAWGLSECSICGIIESAFVRTGPCYFGTSPDHVWTYYDETQDVLGEVVGCVLVSEYPPLTNASFPINSLPANAKWCPGPGALDEENVYFVPITPVVNDPAYNWGLCACSVTQPPTPATLAPAQTPTRFGDTSAPTRSPTKKPTTRSPTPPTPVPTKAPTTSFPTKSPRPTPTKRPVSARPTQRPGPRSRVALFIQTDFSRSIRRATAQCRAESGADSCWSLIVQFISQLVGNFIETYGYDDFRLYLSVFTCYDQIPFDQVLSNPDLTDPNNAKQIENALKRLADMDWRDMRGTCPSKGALRMAKRMERIAIDWPISYFIVTDGAVNWKDERPYKTGIMRIKEQMSREFDVSVCGATLGKENVPNLRGLLNTECIFPAANYTELASRPFARKTAYGLMKRAQEVPQGEITSSPSESSSPEVTTPSPTSSPDDDEEDFTFSPTADVTIPEDPVDPTNSSSSGESGPVISTTATVLGTVLVSSGFLLAAVIVVRSRNRRKKPSGIHSGARANKPKPGDIDWVENPAYSGESLAAKHQARAKEALVIFADEAPRNAKTKRAWDRMPEGSVVSYTMTDDVGTPHPALNESDC